jgi:putative GTP pyrophosphokinase
MPEVIPLCVLPEGRILMNSKELELAKLYQQIQPDLAVWGNYVDNTLMNELLISFVGDVKIPPSYRIKGQQSFLDKALYRKQGYQDPLNEIDDKVATRVVLLKSSEIQLVAALICQFGNWESKITKDIHQLIADQPKIFDYQSMHIVVYPKPGVLTFEHSYRYGCEIQIRTLLQHAFAEVSHDSIYKGPYQYDAGITRHLSKSMALMESTDDYFLNIYKLMSDPDRKYAALLKGLFKIYRSFIPDFTEAKMNIELSDRLMVLVQVCDVSLNEIEAYVEKYQKIFKQAIKKSNGLLFYQPISILIGFFLLRHNDTLREHWPLDQELLKDIFLAFNYSYGNY